MLGLLNNKIVKSLTHKLSLIFAILYLVALQLNLPADLLFKYLLLSIVVVLGIGGIGYLINDYTDIEEDNLANKWNIFTKLKPKQLVPISILLVLCAIVPWFYFPFTEISLAFLVIEFLLFALYSFPPFRLKEKGLAGIILDALYAQVVPIAFAVYTFSLLDDNRFELQPFYFLVLTWTFLLGFRNILKHQLDDFELDKLSKVKTFVQGKSPLLLKRTILQFIVPIEVILFAAMLLSTNLKLIIITATFAIYSVLYFFRRRHEILVDGKLIIPSFFNFVNERILNEFYERWLGLLVLLLMVGLMNNFQYGILLLLHCILFIRILLAK